MDLARRLQQSGAFDAAFYTASYGSDMLAGEEPVTHFVTEGFRRGLKPRATVDPIIRRLRSPHGTVLELIEGIVHDVVHGHVPDRVQSLLPDPWPVPDEIDPDRPGWIDPADNARNARRLGVALKQEFMAGGKPYALTVPHPQELLSRFRDDRPFSFARLSHGDWDSFYFAEVYRQHLARSLGQSATGIEVKMLAYRLCEELHESYDNFAENFMMELEDDLRARPRHPDFLTAVAFKGNPTIDEEIFEGSPAIYPVDHARLDIFARYFSSGETLHDANLFKRWLLSGHLGVLPSLARDRPVILMGAEVLSTLDERWQLPWFSHIVIPPEFSYPLRRSLLDICLSRIEEAKAAAARHGLRKPLFILQGSSFAFWFQVRLFARHPDIFYMELGQALHAWFYDRREIPLRAWGRRYAATIVRNNELEDYYAGLGVSAPIMQTLFANRKVDFVAR